MEAFRALEITDQQAPNQVHEPPLFNGPEAHNFSFVKAEFTGLLLDLTVT
jgi:hypothetical protein